jgi:hypothetical protein
MANLKEKNFPSQKDSFSIFQHKNQKKIETPQNKEKDFF